jgi:hypothetical protein
MTIDEGAQISGKTTVFDFGKVYRDTMGSGFFSRAALIFRLVRMLILFLVAFVVAKAFPGPVALIGKSIEDNYLKNLIVGIIGLILIPVLFIVLLATILGIPVAVLLLPLVVVGGFVLGGTSISLIIGRRASNAMGIQTDSVTVYLALGIFLIELPSLLGRTSQFFSPFLATLFFILTLGIFLTVWIPGFGGVIITKFGRKKEATKSSD